MTDAEALARFGTVGPGRNAHDRLPLSLPIESLLDDDDGDVRVNAHRKEMIHGCGDAAEYGEFICISVWAIKLTVFFVSSL